MNQKQLERELKKLYRETQATVKEKIAEKTTGFKALEKSMRTKVESGKITQREYKQWLRREMLQSQWSRELYSSLEQDIINASQTAANIMNDSTMEFFVDGYNAGLYEIEKGINAQIAFNLYDKTSVRRLLTENPHLLPQAGRSRWGERRLRNAVAQSILKGESIDKLANRLELVTKMEGASAMRNARTIMSSAQNGGRQQVAEDAEEMGINLKKVWLATLDDRTRDSHAEMDGEEANVDEPFDVNGSKLMYPADPNGDPAEVYNCRCTMIYNVDGDLSSVSPDDIVRHGNIGSYDSWKNRR